MSAQKAPSVNALTSLSVKTARHVPRVSIAPRRDSLRASAVPLGLACPQSAPAARAAACHVVRAASTTRRGGPSAARAHKASTQKRTLPTSAHLAHRVDGARMREHRVASSFSRVPAAFTIRQKAPITALRASLALPARPTQSQGAPTRVHVPHVHPAQSPQRTAAHLAIRVRLAPGRMPPAKRLARHVPAASQAPLTRQQSAAPSPIQSAPPAPMLSAPSGSTKRASAKAPRMASRATRAPLTSTARATTIAIPTPRRHRQACPLPRPRQSLK